MHYKAQLINGQEQTKDGLSKSQLISRFGGEISSHLSLNQDLRSKIKELEDLLLRRNKENEELREELASLNKNMEKSMQVNQIMSLELNQYEEKMLTTQRDNDTLKTTFQNLTEMEM